MYLRDGITRYIHNWKRNGWKTADKKPVKNVDLWQRLEAAIEPHNVEVRIGCSGHAGHPENERADALARQVSSKRGRLTSASSLFSSPTGQPQAVRSGPFVDRAIENDRLRGSE